MIEYKCVKIRETKEETEKMLNLLSSKGWEVVCSYSFHGLYIILKRGDEDGF